MNFVELQVGMMMGETGDEQVSSLRIMLNLCPHSQLTVHLKDLLKFLLEKRLKINVKNLAIYSTAQYSPYLNAHILGFIHRL